LAATSRQTLIFAINSWPLGRLVCGPGVFTRLKAELLRAMRSESEATAAAMYCKPAVRHKVAGEGQRPQVAGLLWWVSAGFHFSAELQTLRWF